MLRLLNPVARAGRWLGYALMLWSVGAAAASLEVDPVRVTLSAAQPIAALTVRNAGTRPAGLHLQVVAWTQGDSGDHYAATPELLATPPIFTLAPGAIQTVRVGLRRAVDPQREMAYRIFLQEIPDTVEPDGTGVRIALRIGVPVFVSPQTPAAPLLRWRAQREGDAIVLHAQNTGNAHARVVGMQLHSGPRTVAEAAGAYLLPGQSGRWRLAVTPMPAAGAPLRVSAKTTSGNVDTYVVLE